MVVGEGYAFRVLSFKNNVLTQNPKLNDRLLYSLTHKPFGHFAEHLRDICSIQFVLV